MIIAIGADHRGFAHKEYIKNNLSMINTIAIGWQDVGAYDTTRSDYPLFAQKVCEEMLSEKAKWGVLLCATGVGMAIAANRYKGIYAALAWNIEVAQLSRAHDKANLLVIPSDFVDKHEAVAMIQKFLETSFLQGRYQERIDMLDQF